MMAARGPTQDSHLGSITHRQDRVPAARPGVGVPALANRVCRAAAAAPLPTGPRRHRVAVGAGSAFSARSAAGSATGRGARLQDAAAAFTRAEQRRRPRSSQRAR